MISPVSTKLLMALLVFVATMIRVQESLTLIFGESHDPTLNFDIIQHFLQILCCLLDMFGFLPKDALPSQIILLSSDCFNHYVR